MKLLVVIALKYSTRTITYVPILSPMRKQNTSMKNFTPIELEQLPIPPISNHRLLPHNGRLIKSPECRQFDQKMKHYFIKLRSAVFPMRNLVKEWLREDYCIKLELNFYWPKEKLISKKNEPKRLDLDGRLKSTIDAVAEILDFDDKFVIEIQARKIHWDKSYEECHATISPHKWEWDRSN